MIDRNTIERIMAAADIVDVVGDFVTLRRSGANFKGLCPFHDEKTPSFTVSPAKQLCKCFSCGGGGNVVNFVMQHEQMSYPEALKWLGRKYGIEVREKELTAEEKSRQTTRDAMFVLNEWARDYFVHTLYNTTDGIAIGLSYFRNRGLRDDIIRKFQLGYSLEQHSALPQAAKSKGYEEKYIESTGLCYRTNDGKLIDRYHGRVIFPVHTVSGRVVAFGGRILNTENKKVGKYVNSPESDIYSKKRELYGLYFAKQAIVKQDRCYLVEGYLDVISMHQSGIENVVSSSGTSLTAEQVRLIHRFTNNVTVLYDGDAAGIRASLRGIDMLLSEGLNIKVLLLPDGEDPDSFAQKQSPEAFRQYVEQHQTDFMRFKTELLMKDAEKDPMRRAEVIRDIVRSIAIIPSDIVRQVYIKELSDRIGMDESVIVSEVATEHRKIQSERRTSSSERQISGETSMPTSASVAPLASSSEKAVSSSRSSVEYEPVFDDEGNIIGEVPVSGANSPDFVPQSSTVSPSAVSSASPSDLEIYSTSTPAQRRFAAAERYLMEIVVRYGNLRTFPLPSEEEWEKMSEEEKLPYAEENNPFVANYIYQELRADDLTLQTPYFQQMLDEAVAQVGDENFKTGFYFTLHPNPEIARLASEMTDDRYLLSTKQQMMFTPDEKRLFEIAPRVVMDYKYAILQLQREAVMQQLRNPAILMKSEKVDALMQELMKLNELETLFAKSLGDRVLIR